MKKNSAFSLIELSIVILIIGILIAGVTQASRLVRESRIKTAQTLTKSSPAASITGLVAWYEPTLDESLVSVANGLNPEDTNVLNEWNDINPQTTSKTDITQGTTINQPTYSQNGIGGLPSVKFDGVNDYFVNTTNLPLAGEDDTYTLVIVWQSSIVNGSQTMFGEGPATTSTAARGAMIIANNNGTYGYSAISANNSYAGISYTANTSYITIARVNNAADPSVYLHTNSNTASSGNPANSPTTFDLIATEFLVGVRPGDRTTPFTGLISEIMVFDRALKQQEAQDLNVYFSKKYGIKLI